MVYISIYKGFVTFQVFQSRLRTFILILVFFDVRIGNLFTFIPGVIAVLLVAPEPTAKKNQIKIITLMLIII